MLNVIQCPFHTKTELNRPESIFGSISNFSLFKNNKKVCYCQSPRCPISRREYVATVIKSRGCSLIHSIMAENLKELFLLFFLGEVKFKKAKSWEPRTKLFVTHPMRSDLIN